MFTIKCECGNEAVLKVFPGNILKPKYRIDLDGPIEIKINEEWDMSNVICECGIELEIPQKRY